MSTSHVDRSAGTAPWTEAHVPVPWCLDHIWARVCLAIPVVYALQSLRFPIHEAPSHGLVLAIMMEGGFCLWYLFLRPASYAAHDTASRAVRLHSITGDVEVDTRMLRRVLRFRQPLLPESIVYVWLVAHRRSALDPIAWTVTLPQDAFDALTRPE